MSEEKLPGVHLVGSVALSSAEEVFQEVIRRVGADITRLPDGETGERRTPFPLRKGLHDAVSRSPGLEFKRQVEMAGMAFKLYGLGPGTSPDEVELGRLGFADSAKASYKLFDRLRAEGKIRPGIRMQVCIPTPFMITLCFTAPEAMLDLWPAFERAMLRELNEITGAIPHADLAIQWDVSPEITEVLERRNIEVSGLISRDQVLRGVARITEAVPLDIETGWHLCYGDVGVSTKELETKHPIEPKDLGVLVAFANDLCTLIKRPLNWVHMPVPRNRDDAAYFAPLEDLQLKPGMRLFLGLVHQFDGLDGATRRAIAAREFYPSFGVGTECGMGRRSSADIPELLDLHHQVARML
jgi:hypothetical protein